MATSKNTSSTTKVEFNPRNAAFWLRAMKAQNEKIVAPSMAGLSWIESQSEGNRDLTAMHLFSVINDMTSDIEAFNQLEDMIQAAEKGGAA
jgi:hypothetical protein